MPTGLQVRSMYAGNKGPAGVTDMFPHPFVARATDLCKNLAFPSS